MAMASATLVRAVSSGLVRQRAAAVRTLHAQTRVLFAEASASAANAATAASGPPFKRNFLIATGIMVGIPSVVGAAFVYNLKTDDAFYEHFSDKYPDLIAAINEYVPLNEPSQFANRDDVGDVTAASERLHETVTIVAELRSGKKVRFQAQGSASQAEIEALARQHAGSVHDTVIAINFDEDSESADVAIEEANGPSTTITAAAAWPPAPRTMWTGQPKARRDVVKDAQREIAEIRVQQAALEESKYAGRDIDEADDEIRVLEERKIELKKLLPRKRFLWIF